MNPAAIVHLTADSIAGLNNGDVVQNWQGLTGKNAVNDVAASSPTYVTNVLNSKPIVRFNGVADDPRYLSILDFGVNIRNSTTFVVGKANQGCFVSQRSVNGRWNLYRHRLQVGLGGWLEFGQIFADYHIFTLTGNGDTKSAWVDGIFINTIQETDTIIPTRLNIGTGTNSNQTPGLTFGEFNGDIAEIIICEALATEERLQVELELKEKWFISKLCRSILKVNRRQLSVKNELH